MIGTLNLLKACVDNNVIRFVFSSSSSVYGDAKELPTKENTELNPMSPYALHKYIGEEYCKLYSKLYLQVNFRNLLNYKDAENLVNNPGRRFSVRIIYKN